MRSRLFSLASARIVVISFVFFSGQTLIAGRTSPVFLGIANAVLMVVPSMFIATTPVDVASKAIGFSGLIGAYYIVF